MLTTTLFAKTASAIPSEAVSSETGQAINWVLFVSVPTPGVGYQRHFASASGSPRKPQVPPSASSVPQTVLLSTSSAFHSVSVKPATVWESVVSEGATTVTLQTALASPAEAVIFALPGPTAVITPFSTTATASSEDFQMIADP